MRSRLCAVKGIRTYLAGMVNRAHNSGIRSTDISSQRVNYSLSHTFRGVFCRNRGVLGGRIQSIQDWQDTIYFNQGLITVAEAFEPFATLLAVLEEVLILGFPLRRTS